MPLITTTSILTRRLYVKVFIYLEVPVTPLFPCSLKHHLQRRSPVPDLDLLLIGIVRRNHGELQPES